MYSDDSLPSRDAYIAIAKLCLIAEQNLMILSAARLRAEGTDLPIWVPNLDCKDLNSLMASDVPTF